MDFLSNQSIFVSELSLFWHSHPYKSKLCAIIRYISLQCVVIQKVQTTSFNTERKIAKYDEQTQRYTGQ